MQKNLKKKFSILVLTSGLLIFSFINCQATEEDVETTVEVEKNKYVPPKFCPKHRTSINSKYMELMYSPQELEDVLVSYHDDNDENPCLPSREGNKLVLPSGTPDALESNEEKTINYVNEMYDEKVYAERTGDYEEIIKAYLPKYWYTDIDKNPTANDSLSLAYKSYLNIVQRNIAEVIKERCPYQEKPKVYLKIYNKDKPKELLGTAEFPRDGKVTQKLLMGKKGKIVKREKKNQTLLDGVASINKVGLQKENKNNLKYRLTSYKDLESNISIEVGTYVGSHFYGDYDYRGSKEFAGWASKRMGEKNYENKYENISKKYQGLRQKFERQTEQEGLKIIKRGKEKVNKYYVGYENKYQMPNGEYKLEYNLLFNRNADSVLKKGELFSRITINMQGNEAYLKEHMKEFNKLKKGIKLFKK